MLLSKSTFSQSDVLNESEQVLSQDVSESELITALRNFNVNEAIILLKDESLKLQTEKRDEGGYFLNIWETSFSGNESILYVDGGVATLNEVETAFKLFLKKDMSALRSRFMWCAGEDESVVIPDLPAKLPSARDTAREWMQQMAIESGTELYESDFDGMEIDEASVVLSPVDTTNFTEDEMKSYLDEMDKEHQKTIAIINEDFERAKKNSDSIYNPSWSDVALYGSLNRNLICPHCNEKGKVHQNQDSKKSGISGGKATAVILTAGFSLLATGLSRKEKVTTNYCANCNSKWTFN